MKTTSIYSIKTVSLAMLIAGSFGFSSCKDDDHHNHPHDHDHDVITTLTLRVTNTADSTDTRQISFRDLDGDGGLDGIITPDSLHLRPSAVYRTQITLLNESNLANVIDMTPEVQAEANEHQFFYTPLQGLALTVNNFDLDGNNLPLGLRSDFTTGAGISRGTVRISLNHFDQTPKTGTTPSGETDIEVVFPVRIHP